MPEYVRAWLGDIHAIVPIHWAGVIVTVAAVICGGLIGVERERAQKPAGIRTLILICLGAAIFTQASILIAGGRGNDPGRIAAQVVSGIGFLGAGAIIRERGLLIGVTTGAGIWATAAVGVVLGSGFVAAGAFFTLLIVATLAGSQALDRLVVGPCEYQTMRVRFDPADGRGRFIIQGLLDEHQHVGEVSFNAVSPEEHVAAISYCHVHRDHRTFIPALMSLKQVRRVEES
jgi:putative Mg2+ transporter-C (MgtC) family protein